MRVLHIISTGQNAGTERYLLDLVAHRSAAVEASVICPIGSPLAAAARATGVPVYELNFAPAALPRTVTQLWRHIRALRPDVVHTHLGKATLVGAPVARLAGVSAVVTTLHFIRPAYASTHTRLAYPIFLLGHKGVNRCISRMIAISDAVRAETIAREGVPRAKVVVIPHGTKFRGPPLEGADRQSARAMLGLPDSARVILTVARLEAEKGHMLLLDALPQILQAHPATVCLWAGDGALRPALVREVTSRGLRDQVHLLGFQPDVDRLLGLADLFLLPAQAEPFGLAILEAMAAGLPVVAVDAGGPAEIVVSGETGWLVPYAAAPLAAAVNRLLADPETARAMGAAGRRRVAACYTVERMVRETEAVYRDLLAAGCAARDRPMEAR